MRMPVHRLIIANPPDRPQQAERAGKKKHPAPRRKAKPARVIQHQKNQPRRGHGPTAVPALMMPIAVERSLTGNHSATTRVAAGNPPPSPMPSRHRLATSMISANDIPKIGANP